LAINYYFATVDLSRVVVGANPKAIKYCETTKKALSFDNAFFI